MDLVGKEFSGTTEKEAVRRACQEGLVEPRVLQYEIVEQRDAVTRRNRRFSKPSFCQIRVTGMLDWQELEAEIPASDGPPPEPRGDRDRRGHRDDAGAGRPSRDRGPRRERGGDEARAPRPPRRDRPHGPRSAADPTLGPDASQLPDDPWARAQVATRDILSLMGVDADIAADENGDVYRLDLQPKDAASEALLEAGVLASLQYLVARIAGAPVLDKHIVLDAGGTRQARESTMAEMGQRLEAKVRERGMPVSVYPLSSLDRRAVHQALNDRMGVQTESQGSGAFRRLVIAPASAN